MYTSLFLAATLVSLVALLRDQPLEQRTIFEPGVLIVGLFSLCYLAPAYVLRGASEGRFDLGVADSVSQYGLLFVVSFSIFYLGASPLFRGGTIASTTKRFHPSPSWCLVYICLLFGGMWLVSIAYGVADASDYTAQYLARAGIPHWIAQILNLAQSMQWIFVYILLASSVDPSRQGRQIQWSWIVLGLFIADMVLTKSRANFVTFSLLFAAAYSFYNRPFGWKMEMLFSTVFIVALGAFAFWRAGASELGLTWTSALLPLEFQSIYRNAFHLVAVTGTSDFIRPPGSSYLQGLISFIPKQINSEKWDLATWYVTEYFPEYAGAGGGLAFGVIPEAVVNFGLASIVLQALVVALVARGARLYGLRSRDGGSGAWVLFYLYSISQSYQVVRSNSIAMIGGSILGFLVPYFVVLALGWAANGAMRDAR